MNKNRTVFVGVSGGVDSSVSVALLKEEGYNIFGVFIRTWQPSWIECTWREERRDAMRVCAKLEIPFMELDLSDKYKYDVADYMIDEYRAGRTPNPDVMCNKAIKFGAFLEFALSHGADYIATGHYARIKPQASSDKTQDSRNESHKLIHSFLRGIDENKDQSYFLWTLGQEQLKHTLFPIGHLRKREVRELAEKFGLHTANKKDSQGICFLGKIDMKDFLSHYIKSKTGDVLNIDGEVIGRHDGALFFTLGERHGFKITQKGTDDRPRYVIAKDIEQNTITVSHNSHLTSNNEREITLKQINNISGQIQIGGEYDAQIRYHGQKHRVKVAKLTDTEVSIKFRNEKPLIAEGQSVVLYNGEQCLGGGIFQ